MFKSNSGFSRFMNMVADILLTGILWVAGSILILTAGTATTAAYYTMAKSVRHKEGYVFREYWRSFKSNLKQMLPLTILFVVIMALLIYLIVTSWMNSENPNDSTAATIAAGFWVGELFVAGLLVGLAAWACPLASRFTKTNWGLIKMSVIVMFRYLPITLLVIVLFAASCFGVYFTRGWGIWFIPGICMFVCSLPIEWVLRKLMPKVDPDSEEGQKWYYQDFKRKK